MCCASNESPPGPPPKASMNASSNLGVTGTSRASDRFVRASFYLQAMGGTADCDEAVARAFSVISAVSVPLALSIPGHRSPSPTLWRAASDQKNRRYYFEATRRPNVIWVDLADLDFSAGAQVRELRLGPDWNYAGNCAWQFQPVPRGLAFLPASGT